MLEICSAIRSSAMCRELLISVVSLLISVVALAFPLSSARYADFSLASVSFITELFPGTFQSSFPYSFPCFRMFYIFNDMHMAVTNSNYSSVSCVWVLMNIHVNKR